MNGIQSKGLVFYLCSRIFLTIAFCIITIPMLYFPLYKERLTSIIATQGEVFASTLLAVQSEALYQEDYTAVINYTRTVLESTNEIELVRIKKIDGKAIEIDAKSWTFLPAEINSTWGSKLLPDQAREIDFVDGQSPSILYSAPIVISDYHWGEMQIQLSAEQYRGLLSDYYLTCFWLGFGLIGGVLALLYFSSRPIVRQLVSLRTSANELANGNLNARVPFGGIGEIATLSDAFNAMARSLEDSGHHIAQLAAVVEETNEGFAIFDRDDNLLFLNRAMEELIERAKLPHPENLDQILELFRQDHDDTPIVSQRSGVILRKDATIKGILPTQHVELKLQKIRAQSANQDHHVLSVSDITRRKSLEHELHEIAYYDKLTGLPNRRLFVQTLKAALEEGRQFVVLFMDLDNFKDVNDSLGHEAGDHALKVVTERFTDRLRPDDLLARLGGDEFTVILGAASSKNDTIALCERIVDDACLPIMFGQHELNIGVSIGAVTVPNDANTASEVLRKADVAMYHTKQIGKNGFSFFHADMLDRLASDVTVRKVG